MTKTTHALGVTIAAMLMAALLAGCPGGGTDGEDAGMDAGGGPGGSDGGTDAGGLARIDGKGHAIAVQGDKLIVAGSTSGRGDDFFVGRFDSAGQLDPTFGDGGFVAQDWDGGGMFPVRDDDAAFGLAVSGDSIIVVGGARGYSGIAVGGFAVARYTRDGQLDPSFNGGGLRLVVIPKTTGEPAEASMRAVAVAPSGKILVGGSVFTGSSTGQDYAVQRLNSDGTLDTTFSDPPGSGGVLKHYGSQNEIVLGLAPQGTKVVAAGGSDFLAVRYQDNGAIDTTFGASGKATHPGGEAWAFAARPDGKLVLAGTVSVSTDGGSTNKLKVVQYTADGQPDPGFGTGGAAVTSMDVTYVKGVVVEPSGKLAVFGSDVTRPIVARLNVDGSVDTAFGANGVVRSENLSLPLLQLQYSGGHATYHGGALWFADTGAGTGEQVVANGNGIIVDAVPLP